MSLVRIWRWSALAVAFALAASAARAEMITPNSIPNPPSAVGSANGTPVYANNIVTTQYAGMGLNIGGAAITSLDNISVWAPIGVSAPIGVHPGIGIVSGISPINYAATLGGSFVSLGSSIPTTVSSLTLTTFGINGTPTLEVNGLNGQPLNIVPVLQSNPEPFATQVWTYTGPGISSFSISPSSSQTGAWGVSGISFTPATATAPEPSSLLLAGLGALGMAGRFGWRRKRAVAA